MNKEMTMNAQRAFPLTGRLKWLWLTCFFFPTLFFVALWAVNDSFGQTAGRLVSIIPLVSLIACGTILMTIQRSVGRRLLLFVFAIVGTLLQWALAIIVIGWLALQRSGLEGVQ